MLRFAPIEIRNPQFDRGSRRADLEYVSDSPCRLKPDPTNCVFQACLWVLSGGAETAEGCTRDSVLKTAAPSTGPLCGLCSPGEGWLVAILAAHERGATVVGGALDVPPGLSATARCDYYCGWYLVHSGRPAGPVPHHPLPNLSVRREAFLSTT